MNSKVKDDLNKLDELRDLALCGSEEHHKEAQEEYEKLRAQLLDHEQCEGCEDDKPTKEHTAFDPEGHPRIIEDEVQN